MEKELASYRARKQLEYQSQRTHQNSNRQSQSSWNWSWLRNVGIQSIRWPTFEVDPESSKVVLVLKMIFWFLLWGFFIQVEFGTAFLFLSMFYWLYSSMKEGTRKPWEPSAYSVFNENCEAIEGTLSAEQFERELKFGAGAVRQETKD